MQAIFTPFIIFFHLVCRVCAQIYALGDDKKPQAEKVQNNEFMVKKY